MKDSVACDRSNMIKDQQVISVGCDEEAIYLWARSIAPVHSQATRQLWSVLAQP